MEEQGYSSVAWALFFMTGIAPWILVNALFLQLAAFTDGPNSFAVPEGNAIASHMAVAIQAGNIVTIVYVVANRYFVFDLRKVILGVLILEIFASLALTWAWDSTAVVFGMNVSVTLILAAFASGAVGSMSNVTFWAFATHFCPQMTAAMSLGTSFSNILPSIIAALQLPGPSPTFSPNIFFLLTGVILTLATSSFYLISWSSLASSACEEDNDEFFVSKNKQKQKLKSSSPEQSVLSGNHANGGGPSSSSSSSIAHHPPPPPHHHQLDALSPSRSSSVKSRHHHLHHQHRYHHSPPPRAPAAAAPAAAAAAAASPSSLLTPLLPHRSSTAPNWPLRQRRKQSFNFPLLPPGPHGTPPMTGRVPALLPPGGGSSGNGLLLADMEGGGKERTPAPCANPARDSNDPLAKTEGPDGKLPAASSPSSAGPWCWPVAVQLLSCMMYFYIPCTQTFLVMDFNNKGSVLLWFTIVDKCVGVLGRYAASRSGEYVNERICCIIQMAAFASLFFLGWPLSLSAAGLIAASAVHSTLYSYTNTLLYLNNVRTASDKKHAKAMSEWLGISQQAGASLGIGIGFVQTITGFFKR